METGHGFVTECNKADDWVNLTPAVGGANGGQIG